MSKGNEIIVSADPRGVFAEGYISGTPKPGQIVTIKAGTAFKSGRPTFQAGLDGPASGADNDPRPIAVLLPDHLQGKTATDAYVDGTRCFVYFPLVGEELNILLEGEAGTASANAFTIGERLSVRHSTGKAYAQGTSGSRAPFMCMEHIDEVADTDTLAYCMFAGN